MKKPRISIIAAISEGKRAIGYHNQLLWNIPEDLKRFRELTIHHPVIMGSKTYHSIGKPLEDRCNIVVTRKKKEDFEYLGANSITEALDIARTYDSDEVFIIGGGDIFNQTIDLADRLYLTIVKKEMAADTFFPEYKQFKKVLFSDAATSNGIEYKYVTLER
jgi:dihydrofolate reductase